MSTFIQTVKQVLLGKQEPEDEVYVAPLIAPGRRSSPAPVDIAPNDPIVAHFQSAPGAVEIDKLNLDSPALDSLKAGGVKLVMPLVSQGELIGLLNLGPRLSEQEYSADDRKLLNDLAAQAAPAVRVAQLVRQQQVEARERERIEQELHVARIIQQTLLPKEVPTLPGWGVSVYYQPARAVGGDFYDFIYFPDGRIALIVGDVTDKGVPAALVMATTRSALRTTAERFVSPGKVLQRANELLHPDIPDNMFVTCLYALLDPKSGKMRFANAGHNLPYRCSENRVEELRATGMPLGLMPGMEYEEKETDLEEGEYVLFSSDGLVEAHNTQREMFGFGRLKDLMAQKKRGQDLIAFLLEELAAFTGGEWEQEDDVTLLELMRRDTRVSGNHPSDQIAGEPEGQTGPIKENPLQMIDQFSLPSKPGNEREAMKRVAEALRGLNLSQACLERIKTAVAEATMNAMEHGNQYREEVPVAIEVLASDTIVCVRVIDSGGEKPIPTPETPDIEAKLAGIQSPRGWGLFLIKNMVDEMHTSSDGTHHTIELIIRRAGGEA